MFNALHASTDDTKGARERVASFVENRRFTNFILSLIILNAITLGMATSDTLEERYGLFLSVVDHVIIAVFVAELCLKLFAYRVAFFRSGWNNFDFFVVAISIFPATGGLSVLRTLRVFRVLRVISIVPRMRRVVDALLSAIPGMTSVVAVLLVIFYVGAVLTTELFIEPELQVYFGDIGNSMFTLFQVMTFEAWPEIAHAVMVYHPWAWAFFIFFITITSFAVLNLFIGIIVDAMNIVKEEDMHEEQDLLHRDIVDVKASISKLEQDISAIRQAVEDRR